MEAIDKLPLWIVFSLVLAISLIVTECGFRSGKYSRKTSTPESRVPLGTVVASILGLLAFILAFTFNVALSRFDDRRVAVLDEANAIGTTYLRCDFFDARRRDKIRELLRQYVQVRINGIYPKSASLAISQSEALQDKLWSEAADLGRENQSSPVCALFISSLNDVIDLHAKRTALGLHARVPVAVWLVLFAVSVLALIGVGYYCGASDERSRMETIVLIVSFAVVMLLCADLDRPREGLIQTSQQPMIDLQNKIGWPRNHP